MAEPKGPSELVSEAYRIGDEAGTVEFCPKWAEDYDRQGNGLGYRSATEIARLLRERLPDPGSEILDLGCGTGLSCVYLAERGYTRLDGIDRSPDMI